MFTKEDDRVPIIKGTNDCFFEEDKEFFHVDRIYEICPGFACELYKPLKPLKR